METNTEQGLESRTWLSPAQAALYSGLGRSRIYELLRSGEIPNARVGGTRHVRRADVDAYFEKHMSGGAARG